MEQTNSYAEETMGANAYASWKPITSKDIRAFMGFNILMGINCQSSTEDYGKRIPFTIINLLPKEFQEIGFGIFQDNSTLSLSGSANYDKFGKFRPLINHFQ